MVAYRDDLEAAKVKLELCRERTAALEAQTTSALFERLEPSARATLARAKEKAYGLADQQSSVALTRLVEIQAAWSTYEALLSEAIAEAPGLEQSFNRLPDEVDPTPILKAIRPGRLARRAVNGPKNNLLNRSGLAEPGGQVAETLEAQLRSIDPETRSTLSSGQAPVFQAWLRVKGTPIYAELCRFDSSLKTRLAVTPLLLPFPYAIPALLSSGVLEYKLSLVTAVAESSPRFRLRESGFFKTLFGRSKETKVKAIDGVFGVRGDVSFIRRVFSVEIAKKLRQLSSLDLPTIQVSRGLAFIKSQYPEEIPPAAAADRLGAAIDILAEIRKAGARARLLR